MYFIIKTLYSALLDADRLDAAGILPLPARIKIESERVANFVKTIPNESSETINKFRNILFDNVYRHSQTIEISDQRIFTMTAPTGLGKTLSSINFALRLRKRIESERRFSPRIIYVAPFISILDQNTKGLLTFQDTEKRDY
jgi:CRISPR-associated endonuclease/helicase Cas3